MNKHDIQLDLETIFIAQSVAVAGCSISALLIDRIREASEDVPVKPIGDVGTEHGILWETLTRFDKRLSNWSTRLLRIGGHVPRQSARDPIR